MHKLECIEDLEHDTTQYQGYHPLRYKGIELRRFFSFMLFCNDLFNQFYNRLNKLFNIELTHRLLIFTSEIYNCDSFTCLHLAITSINREFGGEDRFGVMLSRIDTSHGLLVDTRIGLTVEMKAEIHSHADWSTVDGIHCDNCDKCSPASGFNISLYNQSFGDQAYIVSGLYEFDYDLSEVEDDMEEEVDDSGFEDDGGDVNDDDDDADDDDDDDENIDNEE